MKYLSKVILLLAVKCNFNFYDFEPSIRKTLVFSFVFILFSFNPDFGFSQRGRDWLKTSFMDSNKVNFLQQFGDTIFAGTLKGLFSTIDEGVTWDTLNTLHYLSSLTKFGNKYYASSYMYGIQSSSDLLTWNNVTSKDPLIISCTLGSHSGLYIGTSRGVFILDTINQVWLQDSLKNKCIHNDYIWQLHQFENIIYAIGSNFTYAMDVGDSIWHPVPGKYDYEGLRSKFLHDTLMISTSGDGIYIRPTNEDTIFKYTGHEKLIKESFVPDFDSLGNDIIFLSGDKIKLSDSISDNICNSLLTALLVTSDQIYVGTDSLGIWKLAVSDSLLVRSSPDFTLSVLPNPSSGEIRIFTRLEPMSKFALYIINSQGTQLYRENIQTNKNPEDKIIYQVLDIPGIYYVIIDSGRNKLTKKIIIQ